MTLLYISNNDGTEPRIIKELKSLSKNYNIIFLGNASKMTENSVIFDLCEKVYFINEKRNSIKSIFKSFFLVFSILLNKKIHSIHVINEQLMIFYYPIFFFKHSVLDLFDSIFLKINYTNNKLSFIKRLSYLPFNKILVTDNNRFNLMPDFVKKKTIVLENFPFKLIKDVERKPDPSLLSIFYSGNLSCVRGTLQMKELCSRFPDKVKLYLAGWINDKQTEELCDLPNTKYLGYIPQQKALEFANSNCDYLLCLYAPTNYNNVNASPNKIFDAIQCNVPVIINSEVTVSNFVAKNQLGYILDSFYQIDYDYLLEDLMKNKSTFSFSQEIKNKYTWERIENILITAHKHVDLIS